MPSSSPSPSRYPLYLSPLEQLGHEFFDGLKAHEDDSLNTIIIIIIIIIIIDHEAMRRHHQFAGCTHYSITSQLKQHYIIFHDSLYRHTVAAAVSTCPGTTRPMRGSDPL